MLRRQLFLTLLMLVPLAGWALTLDEAKEGGLVGEDASGYIAAVSDRPTRDVKALVEEINGKRRAAYEGIVAANGNKELALSDVEKLAGKKAIEKSPPGDYIRLPGEAWRRKE